MLHIHGALPLRTAPAAPLHLLLLRQIGSRLKLKEK